MRRFLVLALTMALGMTALVAIPASAGSRSDDCTWVQTYEGRECLNDREYREHRDRDKYDKHDKNTDRERRQLRSRRNRLERDFWGNPDWDPFADRPRWLRNGNRTDRCECLSSREVRRLERLAVDPDRKDRRQILRYLRDQDCFSDREFRQVRRKVRNADAAELRDIIRDAARCECTSNERRHLRTKDIRRLDRHTRLDDWTVRRYLGLRDGRDCVTRRDVRRLDRRADDLDYWDILDFLGGYGRF